MRVRIVLVEPREGGNVGASARVMKNFGFDDLVLVGRPPFAVDDHSRWWAAGAEDLLESVRRTETLEEALADCHVTVATTAIRGRQVVEQLTPAEVGEMAAGLEEDHRIAIVFGRETWGLTGQEISLCQRTSSIPASPVYPTLNLAQSVALFCYELGRRKSEGTGRQRDLAPGELMQALQMHTRALITQFEFFGEKNPDRICTELQALAGRALLSTREASLLLAFVRQVELRIGGGTAGEDRPPRG